MKTRLKTNKLVVHCAATKPSMYVKAATIRKWHVEERGWSDIGYHWFIRRNGFLEPGRDEHRTGSHAKGFNSESIAICLAGGMSESGNDENNFTDAQMDTLKHFIKTKMEQYPGIEVLGHRDLPKVNKPCPCFDVKEYLELWGLTDDGVDNFMDDLESETRNEY
jgi:N-acetylmuramoyl-L-alanine amidase